MSNSKDGWKPSLMDTDLRLQHEKPGDGTPTIREFFEHFEDYGKKSKLDGLKQVLEYVVGIYDRAVDEHNERYK